MSVDIKNVGAVAEKSQHLCNRGEESRYLIGTSTSFQRTKGGSLEADAEALLTRLLCFWRAQRTGGVGRWSIRQLCFEGRTEQPVLL